MAFLVFSMVVVGGATRLTGSGLSITEWRPIMGALPPLSDTAWLEAFEKYKEIPQYKLLNSGMGLAEFKSIFWWEWSHRQLGRGIGLVFGVGFIGLFAAGILRGRRAFLVLFVGALGGLQALIGWLMVASGLAEGMLAVAPVRLMAHLVTASVIFVLLIMIGTKLGRVRGEVAPTSVARGSLGVMLIVLLQIALGALVAGSKAGLTWNTWPLIDGHVVPPSDMLFSIRPWIENFVDNTALVQFNHRLVAYLLLGFAIWHAWRTRQAMPGSSASRRATSVAAMIAAQAVLGIVTLLYVIPLPLALAHQAMAFLVLGMAVAHWAATVRG